MRTLTRHPVFHDPAVPGSEKLTDEHKRQVEWFNRSVRSGEILMEEVPCLCGSTSFDLVATYDRYRIWQPVVICTACGLLQCRPRMAPKTLEWFYESDFYRSVYSVDKSLLSMSLEKFRSIGAGVSRRRDEVARHLDYAKIRTVAEVGCGAGWNLCAFQDDGKIVTGCDYSPGLVELGRKFGLNLRQGDAKAFGDEKFDLIVLSHVVEHFSDPVTQVRDIVANLADGGALFIEVPDNRAFCIGALHGAHLYYFSPNTLAHFMGQLGLRRISLNIHSDVFFSCIFVRDTPQSVDLSGEYARTAAIIRSNDRRERLKSTLERVGLLGLVRSMVRLYRRSTA